MENFAVFTFLALVVNSADAAAISNGELLKLLQENSGKFKSYLLVSLLGCFISEGRMIHRCNINKHDNKIYCIHGDVDCIRPSDIWFIYSMLKHSTL